MDAEIPTVFEGPFGFTIGVHWHYHAWLMFTIWIVLVPAVVLFTRFGKPAPTLYGSISRPHEFLAWFVLHRYGLFVLALLSAGGGAVAVVVSRGYIPALHSAFGIATVLLGLVQVGVASKRGSRGGKYGVDGTLNDEALWAGDHYDMTPRRLWFEAVHKPVGYLTMATALGAVATGLGQFWVAGIAVALPVAIVLFMACTIALQGVGRWHDTYESYYGNHPLHPYNRRHAVDLSGDPASRRAAEAQGMRPGSPSPGDPAAEPANSPAE